MPLEAYRRKRDFTRTREPRGRKKGSAGSLSFVVQKHAARQLHYDFRLELDGALKSWAVPKGPSLDPGEKRLAVHVEDHPLEYAAFEGTIPEGEYGAGTVEIWDKGYWIPEGDPRAGYRSGRLKFTLKGRKLRGAWNLVRMKDRNGKGRDNWLLMKAADTTVSDGVSQHRKREALSGSGTNPLPEFVEPQLAILVDDPPPGEQWVHEIKFDGYRLLCRIDGGKVRILTRHGKDWSERFQGLVAAAKDLPVRQALIDGEAVVLDEGGISSFQALQEALSAGRDRDVLYFAFDLLYLDGLDLRRIPLVDRKAALATLVKDSDGRIRYADHVEGNGEEFFRRSCAMSLEGILSKKKDGAYESGRSGQWLKVKCERTRQEFVIGGYTDPEGTRSGFGALLLGVYDDAGQLQHAGRVGTGFNEKTLADIHGRLRRLERKTSPFDNEAGTRKGVHWVEPRLVAEVAFRNWTRDGLVRQATFLGLREDKPATEVVRERPRAVGSLAHRKSGQRGRPRARRSAGSEAPRSPRSEVRRSPSKETQDTIAGVTLTNPDRILYPEQALTKRALASFYRDIAKWILPHIVGRPLTLLRCPEGHTKQCFFQKHAAESTPETLKRIELEEEEGRGIYLYVEGLAGLITLVQLGVLEIHPWGSRVEDPDRPDRMIFDLDPSPGVAWSQVVKTARWLHERLADVRLESFVKNTGGKGLHIVVPLAPVHTWDEVKDFSKAIAQEVVGLSAGEYTINPLKAARKGKILVDYLRNARGATSVAPYSTRARPGAPISTPLAWNELGRLDRPNAYTVSNFERRLAKLRKDPWEGYFKKRQKITSLMRRAVGLS